MKSGVGALTAQGEDFFRLGEANRGPSCEMPPRLLPTHPKGYTSVQYPLADQIKKFFHELRIGGLFHAVNRLRQMNHLRSGRLVGEDTNGNKYYENTNAAYGARAPCKAHAAPRVYRCALRPVE